jgi:hypothetical protein
MGVLVPNNLQSVEISIIIFDQKGSAVGMLPNEIRISGAGFAPTFRLQVQNLRFDWTSDGRKPIAI